MRLNEKQITVIKDEARAYKEAAESVGKAHVALWQARIDLAIKAALADPEGGGANLDDLLNPSQPVAIWDCNSSCNKNYTAGPEAAKSLQRTRGE